MYILLLFLLLFPACSSHFTPSSSQTAPAAKQEVFLSGTITVDPKLQKKIQKGDTLYIIVKKTQKMPPLAVKKVFVEEFPLSFELGLQDIMIPGMPLEGEVSVVARIDKDGIAGPPQPGDFEGKTVKPVPIGNQSITIKINKAF